jgi:hypothetical protein
MFIVDAACLVRGGRIAKHPASGLFRAYLRGRKPSLILAYSFFVDGEGLLLSLQSSLKSCLTYEEHARVHRQRARMELARRTA